MLGFDPRSVSNTMLDVADMRGLQISNLALNKVLYFAHADWMREHKVPLINVCFEAWQYGPVVPIIYHAFKKFGEEPILGRAEKISKETGDMVIAASIHKEPIRTFLEHIVDFYGGIPVQKLVWLSHVEGGPWDTIWNGQQSQLGGLTIPNKLIMERNNKVTD